MEVRKRGVSWRSKHKRAVVVSFIVIESLEIEVV